MKTYAVLLYDNDASRMSELRLPFPPYPGLCLLAGWARGGDYVRVIEVFYDDAAEQFECYAEAGS